MFILTHTTLRLPLALRWLLEQAIILTWPGL